MPLDDNTRARLAMLLARQDNPGAYDETGAPMPATRSGIAGLLMGLRDKIPENPGTGWSGLNMLRGGLERSANLQDTVAGYRDPKTADPLDLVPMLAPGAIAGAMRGPARSTLMSAGGVPPKDPPGFTAYHGSPHDFDRFSLDKIGTGEGAQAYGHGLYFADAEPVARQYRNSLSGSGLRVGGEVMDAPTGGPGHAAYQALIATKGDVAAATRMLATDPAASNVLKFWDSRGIDFSPGHMYEVRIKADPNEFLDWDKPLKEQPEKVRRILEPELKAAIEGEYVAGYHPDTATVGDAIGAGWSRRPAKGDREAVTNLLREHGFPGIRYDDAMTRGKGEGTRNTVVFDDKLIDIIRKYGLAALLASGGLAASGGPSDAKDKGP